MSFIFDPLWESSDEDDIANDVYEDIIMVKIKEIGLMPRWLAVEEKNADNGVDDGKRRRNGFSAHSQAAPFRKVKRVVALYVRRFRNKVGEPRPT